MISTIFGMWTLSGPAVRRHAELHLNQMINVEIAIDFTCNEFNIKLAPL